MDPNRHPYLMDLPPSDADLDSSDLGAARAGSCDSGWPVWANGPEPIGLPEVIAAGCRYAKELDAKKLEEVRSEIARGTYIVDIDALAVCLMEFFGWGEINGRGRGSGFGPELSVGRARVFDGGCGAEPRLWKIK